MPPMEMPARQYCKNADDVMNIPPDMNYFCETDLERAKK